ncbi:DUF485 domain-containing protein [Sphingomonas sp. M1-B02]|uniref:DUF485 domain-containing protein n=1 Tax=Sphingomonas sp. M1-B02 TaxID=3114300 RepID=UPI00223F9EEF|nr:DUF485 domain-containing protein [Sphingomonas sp. S6-11]UZK65181.1 DUF485 domain-containing protein [Sphingomonas sp. S6-11]
MNERDGGDERLHRIAEDPRYQALVRLRSRISWTMSAIVVAIFFGYMLLVAFAGSFLGTPIGAMTTTIGIPIGLFVILSGIALTGIYVAIANRRFDIDATALLKDHGE